MKYIVSCANICFRVKLGMENQQVWVRDPQEGFIIGKFTDMLDGDALIVPLDPKYPQRTCPLDEVYPAGEYTKDVEDNCKFRSEYFCELVSRILRYTRTRWETK